MRRNEATENTNMQYKRFALGLLVSLNVHRVVVGQDIVPQVDVSARVKEHRRGAQGDLVSGEEEMRKVIIQWDSIPDAILYEVCHNCKILADGTQQEIGEISSVPMDLVRAGRPVFIKPNAPRGINTFHVRASIKEGEWGPWSEQRTFDVQEPGNAVHDEF